MRARPLLLGLLWLAVTAALTATAWLAVQLVATQVGGETTSVLSADAVQKAAAADDRSPTATPSPTPSRSTTPRPTASSSPRSTPAATSTPKPTANGPTTHTRTFAVTGGTVAASCTGSTAALRSAQPRDGWGVEVKDRGPDRVEVEFRADEAKTKIQVRCSGGVPTATVENDDDGGGGDDGGHGGGGGSGPG